MKLNCDNSKLKEVVLEAINNFGRLFTFKQLIDAVCLTLDDDNLLSKEHGVTYTGGYKLNTFDSDKVQIIVWEQILEGKIIIDMLNDRYDYSSDRESTRLIKVNQDL